MIVTRTIIERITIECAMDKSTFADDYCFQNDYTIIRSGAKRINNYRVDLAYYTLIAEKEVSHDTNNTQD